ncbi:hypothetical protein R3P38DRAFT_2982421 [Favolaschia claudopus]|uniref:F-box domain-containing protein n=1 Tax=Favolaschia claudopus TaxID=2862362 RepID=A0AAW0AYH2_9AGAR
MRPPALSLPAEIVAEIFTKFVPNYPECPPLHGLHSPSLLGQIGGLWRAIAFSTPSLWRAVEIKVSKDDSLRVANILDILSIWLSRSGSGPLSIRLESPQPTKYITVNVDPIVDTIIRQSHRLEYLNIHIPLESLFTIEGAIDAHRCAMPLR